MTQELTVLPECVLSALGDNNKVRRSCAFERIGLSNWSSQFATGIAGLVGTVGITNLTCSCFVFKS